MIEDLISLLKEVINNKKKEIKEYNSHLDKNLSEKIEILDNLRSNINEIIKIKISKLNEIVDGFQISAEAKENMKKELDVIKALLTLNQEEKTNYQLLPNQLATLSSFLDNLERYIDEKTLEQQEITPEYKEVITITNRYKKLLYKIKNPNAKELITDREAILQLFEDSKITEEQKQIILLVLIKYNEAIIKEKTKNNKNGELTIKELIDVLNKYSYSLNKLDKKLQEKLQKYGNLKNIEEVLATMQKLEFPKLDEKTEGLILITYLIATTKTTLEEITKFAQNRGINLTELKDLVCAYIPNDYLYENKFAIGRKEDFIKNMSLFSEYGISITTVMHKGKDLLLVSNKKLQKNLEWLECYGLYSNMQEDVLLDDFISALKSQNIPEVIDLWIENHSLGFQYIKNNLSILATHISNQAILFYKLYKAQKDKYTDTFRLTVSNGVKKLSLHKEITHDDIDYHGIHDKESALSITKQYKPIFPHEKEYEQIAKKSLESTISDEVFTKEEIVRLNVFRDASESLLYNIHGLRISKLKVLRIYDALCKENLGNSLDALLYAICYNKIMEKEQYEKLIIAIKQETNLKEV